MTSWIWIERETIVALHQEQLAEHGGQTGIRDEGLLDSALARAKNKEHYESPSVTDLAAAYGYGIARNHPFLDGNKRTALVATELFLVLNGYELTATDVECLTTFLSLAEGSLSEEQFAAWLESSVRRAD